LVNGKFCFHRLAPFVFYFSLLTSLSSQPFDPSLHWKTMETTHFSVHYYETETSIALEISKISENIYDKLTQFLDWHPKGKIQIVLSDAQDLANAYANPFPINTIVIYLCQPPPEDECYEDWIREIVTHELTHIIQLDRTEGFPSLLREIFGRIMINNAAQPIWFIEGLAVNTESKFTNGGRLNSARFKMMLGEDIKTGNLKSIDRASNFPLVWPGGITPYLYGGYFVSWLSKKYGDESISEYNRHTARGIPFAVNTAAKRTFKKDFVTLWKEWEKELSITAQEYKTQEKTKPLTNNGQWNLSPTFSPDANTVAFITRSLDEYPELKLLSVETGKTRKIVEGYINPGISWSEDGKKLLFSRIDTESNYYFFSNIYEYNIISKKLNKIKGTERGKFPTFTSNGKGILFVREHCGSNDLCIIYPENDRLVTIFHNDDHTQYHYPHFLPDSEKILMSIWRKGKGEQIYIFNTSDNTLEKLTREGDNFSAQWSDKFHGIFFISDNTGTYQLRFYSFEDKKTYCVSDIGRNMLYPDISPDENQIVFSEYASNGYNIHTLCIDEKFKKSESSDMENVKLTFRKSEITTEVHSYNPLPYLLPKFWLPFPLVKERSVSPAFGTMSQDVLQKHSLFLYAAYFLPKSNIVYDFTYTNNCFRPEIFIESKKDFLASGENWIGEKQKNAYITLTQHYTRAMHSISAGYERDVYSMSNTTYNFSNILLSYYFSNRLRFPRSIEYERGGYFTGTYRYYSKVLWGDYTFHNLKTKASYYFTTPFPHNVISLKLASGLSISDSANIGLMTIGGNEGTFAVRGYESGIYYGKFVFTGSLSYALPLLWIERGIRTYPVYFHNISMNLFTDFGTTALEFPPDNFQPWLNSIGAEVSLSFDLFYSQVPCNFTAGVAVTKQKTEHSFYLNITSNIPYLFYSNHIIESNMAKPYYRQFIQ